ncbi:hypothetical protein CKK34_5244 [Yarrowia sp. E02]|nr:hypothetical protein CKK34_5244 [Yarrowia sp. E02]
MTESEIKYEQENIYFLKSFKHRKEHIMTIMSAVGEVTCLGAECTDDFEKHEIIQETADVLVQWFHDFHDDANPNTVVIIDPVTDRQFNFASKVKAHKLGVPKGVRMVVPYVFQWTVDGKLTGENYKNIHYPISLFERYMKTGFPMQKAMDKSFRNDVFDRAWDQVNLDDFAQELDCIETDIRFKPYYGAFYDRNSERGLWSVSFMNDPIHLEDKKDIIEFSEGIANGTQNTMFNTPPFGQAQSRGRCVIRADIVVKEEPEF